MDSRSTVRRRRELALPTDRYMCMCISLAGRPLAAIFVRHSDPLRPRCRRLTSDHFLALDAASFRGRGVGLGSFSLSTSSRRK